jgi:hypothetical protein
MADDGGSATKMRIWLGAAELGALYQNAIRTRAIHCLSHGSHGDGDHGDGDHGDHTIQIVRAAAPGVDGGPYGVRERFAASTRTVRDR